MSNTGRHIYAQLLPALDVSALPEHGHPAPALPYLRVSLLSSTCLAIALVTSACLPTSPLAALL